jgi:hypothetical protein
MHEVGRREIDARSGFSARLGRAKVPPVGMLAALAVCVISVRPLRVLSGFWAPAPCRF